MFFYVFLVSIVDFNKIQKVLNNENLPDNQRQCFDESPLGQLCR